MPPLLSWLDPWLLRGPFEGRGARRYAQRDRCGFGDLDERLMRLCGEPLASARCVLDLGAGPCVLARKLVAAQPRLRVVAVEPSATYARDCAAPRAGINLLRARAEHLPLAEDSVDLAFALSSIRHVRERRIALRELRRVVKPGGRAYVVELDPQAPRERRRAHTRRVASVSSRVLFSVLILRTAPTAGSIERLALDAGWQQCSLRRDERQPVYVLELR